MNNKLITRDQYLAAADVIIQYRQQILAQLKEANDMLYNYNTPINQLDLSQRAYNCLVAIGCSTFMDVISMPINKMRMAKNWGRKSEKELIEFKAKHAIT